MLLNSHYSYHYIFQQLLKIFNPFHFFKENIDYFVIIESLTENLNSQITLLKSRFIMKKYLCIHIRKIVYFIYDVDFNKLQFFA